MIERIFVASTANITHIAAQFLERNPPDIIAYSKADYGWFIYTGHRSPDLPMSLHDLMVAAQNEGCVWLMLDRDADPLEGFPTYDW